jgi:hypothetical protein
MQINIARLRTITDHLLEHLFQEGIVEVELTSGYYWQIEPELRYDKHEEPASFTMGQLSEDLHFLEQIENGERPPVAYGLVWVAALLRYVGEQVVK